MNNITLIGRMTADAELKTTNNGVSVTSFTVAVDRAYTPKGQEKRTDFIKCVAWSKTAEFLSKNFHKGEKIGIVGRMETRNYEDHDGNKRTAYEVIVESVDFCESKKNEYPQDRPQDFHQNDDGFTEVMTDEELPF